MKEPWWWLFPISGVTLEDEQLSLDEPITPDITIVRVADLVRFSKEKGLRQPESLQLALDQNDFIDNEQYFVAVKSFADHDMRIDTEAKRIAEQKVDEFVSLLMLYEFFRNGISTCGLTSKISDRKQCTVIISDKSNRWSKIDERKDPLIFPNSGGLGCKASDLVNNLKESHISLIAEVLLNRDPYHRRATTRLAQAVRALAHAMYTNGPGEIISGVWLMFEILLSENQESKDTVTKKRVSALTGMSVSDVHEQIYQPRNLWIHQWVPPESKQARGGLDFAIMALVNYARIMTTAAPQTSWHTIITWLDLRAIRNAFTQQEELDKLNFELEGIKLFSRMKRKPRFSLHVKAPQNSDLEGKISSEE